MASMNRGFCPIGERGAAAVELAFVLTIMLMLVAGVVEFGRVMWYYDALAKATRDGARLVSITDFASIGTAVGKAQSAVVSAATAAGLSGIATGNVSVRCDDDFNDSVDYACTDSRFTSASPPVRVSVTITGYSMTVGGLLPLVRQDGTAWASFGVAPRPKTSMPYMR